MAATRFFARPLRLQPLLRIQPPSAPLTLSRSLCATAVARSSSSAASTEVVPSDAAPSPSTSTNLTSSPKYFVNRTPSDQLPIYEMTKNGGTRPLTRIRKIDGDAEILANEIIAELGIEKEKVRVNRLTNHVWITGHRKKDLMNFLISRNF